MNSGKSISKNSGTKANKKFTLKEELTSKNKSNDYLRNQRNNDGNASEEVEESDSDVDDYSSLKKAPHKIACYPSSSDSEDGWNEPTPEITLSRQDTKKSDIKKIDLKNCCPFCSILIDENNGEMIYTFNCGDTYHLNCATRYIDVQRELNLYPLKCSNKICNSQLSEEEIDFVFECSYISGETKDFSLKPVDIDSSIFKCITERCSGIINLKMHNRPTFNCELCGDQYCTYCKQKYHFNEDCEIKKFIIECNEEEVKEI